ncbi:MAG: hypothetical protein U5K84_09975 [Alkalibacterium sp.]|nr:hypothetical protein [Alkalibacterium sp.]
MVFKQIESQTLPDIHSEGHLYEHEETGAKVLHLANDAHEQVIHDRFQNTAV